MKKTYINLILLLTFILIVFSSCDDTILTDVEIPESNVSYSRHIQPIFNVYCNSSICHSREGNAGDIILESWTELKAAFPPIVVDFNPEESKLYLSIIGQSPYPMPKEGSGTLPLTEKQINGIKTWIEEGAEAN